MNLAAPQSTSTGMNRHLTLSVLLAILSLVGIARRALVQDSLIPLVKRIQPAVVTVLAYDATGQPLQQGSGFFVSTTGHLVTNRHVLQGASRAEVQPPDGRGMRSHRWSPKTKRETW